MIDKNKPDKLCSKCPQVCRIQHLGEPQDFGIDVFECFLCSGYPTNKKKKKINNDKYYLQYYNI